MEKEKNINSNANIIMTMNRYLLRCDCGVTITGQEWHKLAVVWDNSLGVCGPRRGGGSVINPTLVYSSQDNIRLGLQNFHSRKCGQN